MRISIHHTTRYTYPEEVQFTPHRALVRPRENPYTRVLSMDLSIEPEAQVKWRVDPFENQIAGIYFARAASQIVVDTSILVELNKGNPFDFILEPYAELYPFSYVAAEKKALAPFMEIGPASNCTKVLPWVWDQFPQMPGKTIDLLTQLNHRIHDHFQYVRREEEGVQTPDETISKGSGSCRDFTRLLMEAARQLGFAARFASGYLYDPPTGSQHIENVARGAMHACAEIYLPGAGWKGFDPTNGILSSYTFIPCAVANEPKLTSPIQGSYYHPQDRIPSSMEVTLTVDEADTAGQAV